MRDRARGADSLAPQEKQSDPDRRSGRGQERHRRGVRAADRSGRRSLHHRGQAALFARRLVAGGGHEVPRRIRGADAATARRAAQSRRHDHLHRRDPHHRRRGGRLRGSLDTANILKPALARGELQTIGATTLDEYRENIEKRLGARTPLPSACWSNRPRARRRSKFCATSRPATRRTTKSAIRTRRSKRA